MIRVVKPGSRGQTGTGSATLGVSLRTDAADANDATNDIWVANPVYCNLARNPLTRKKPDLVSS